jgi:patatin-like phospholipase/acyl hydrolase
VLIDGGVIANNPAMYAYLHSKFANGQKKIRLVSIGTGDTEHTKFTEDKVNKVDWLF